MIRQFKIYLILLLFSIFNTMAQETNTIKLTVIYDNYQAKEGLESDWGFSCLIEGTEKTILFDTGAKGSILMSNMKKLKKDPASIDVIVLSHDHWDHTGGLSTILSTIQGVEVCYPVSFPSKYDDEIKNLNSTPIRVSDPMEICSNISLTGQIDGSIPEQSLILETGEGSVVITGCSHPGIVTIIEKVKEIKEKDIYLVFGGFHMMGYSKEAVSNTIDAFRSLGVKKCGPSHCTGDKVIKKFKQEFGENYVKIGVGKEMIIEKE